MSNVTLPANGSVIATETVGTSPNQAEVQRIKLITGALGTDGGDVTASNPFPIQPIAVSGGLTDRSGTTSNVGGSSTQAMAANASRKYLLVQNPADAAETLFVNVGSPATTTAKNCIELPPGASLTFEGGFMPNTAIYVATATASLPFIAKEA